MGYSDGRVTYRLSKSVATKETVDDSSLLDDLESMGGRLNVLIRHRQMQKSRHLAPTQLHILYWSVNEPVCVL